MQKIMDQNIQQTKSNSKIAFISLMLGTISLLMSLTPILFLFLGMMNPMAPTPILEIIFKISPIIAVIGLVLGVKVFKSQKGSSAIIGVLLCIIVLCIFILKERIIVYILSVP